jgi:cytochrome c553
LSSNLEANMLDPNLNIWEEIMKTFISIVALALLPAAAAAADRPDWAFPSKSAGPAVASPPDDGQAKHVPGSTKSYTQKEIDSINSPPDWFPNEHPPTPNIVAHGKGDMVRACMSCHLPTGYGHPENSRLAGSPAAYIIRQIDNFRSGVRKGEGAGNMVKFAKYMTDEDAKAAADYFASIKPGRWTKVVETDTVPKTYFKGTRRLQLPDGGKEAIGNRIIEVPQDPELVELRDTHAGFVSYVPPGSVAKGENIVTTGAGKTIPCAICHGQGLKGLGEVPPLAGRSPGTIARAIYYIQTGDRGGPSVALMKGVVEKLTGDDVLAISAYVASLEP